MKRGAPWGWSIGAAIVLVAAIMWAWAAFGQTALTVPPTNPVTPQCVSGTGASTTYTNCTPSNPFPVTAAAPQGATTTMTSGSVATQNVFQSILASSTTRKGCTLQNTSTSSTDILYVYFGANGSATKAGSFQVQPNQALYCTTNTGLTTTDNISITCADVTSSNCTWVLANQ